MEENKSTHGNKTVNKNVKSDINSKPQKKEETKSTKEQKKQDGGHYTKKTLCSAILIGSAAEIFHSFSNTEQSLTDAASGEHDHAHSLDNIDVPVADAVNNDMSFPEAFAQARNEIGGGGGVFEWKGNLFSTYTAEEWAELDQDSQTEQETQFHLDDDQHFSSISIDQDNQIIDTEEDMPEDIMPTSEAEESSAATSEDSENATEGMSDELETPDNVNIQLDQTFDTIADDVLVASIDNTTNGSNEEAPNPSAADIELAQNYDQSTDDALVASINEISRPEDIIAQGLNAGNIHLAQNIDTQADDALVASIDAQNPNDINNQVANNTDASTTGGSTNPSYSDIHFTENFDTAADDQMIAAMDHTSDEHHEEILTASRDNIDQLPNDTAENLLNLNNSQIENLTAEQSEIEEQLNQTYRGEISAENLTDYEFDSSDFVNNGNVDNYDTV